MCVLIKKKNMFKKLINMEQKGNFKEDVNINLSSPKWNYVATWIVMVHIFINHKLSLTYF